MSEPVPPPPSVAPPSAPPPGVSPPAGEGSPDDRNLAALTHASGILFGFLVPLIVWLLKKDQSPWLGAQAKEALNFQLTVLIAFVASWILTFVLIGLLMIPVVLIGNLVLCIIAAVKTSSGQAYRYPFALRLVN
jgi:hypothetical protein